MSSEEEGSVEGSIDILDIFGEADKVDLFRDGFRTKIHGQRYRIYYNHRDAEAIMRKMNASIFELRIFKYPPVDIESLLSPLIDHAQHLRLIKIFDENFYDREEYLLSHMRRFTTADVTVYYTKIAQLASETSTDKVLFLDRNVGFDRMARFPFDIYSYYDIEEIHIHGVFNLYHLNEVYIQGFVNFINAFPNLETIYACFIMKSTDKISGSGCEFYQTMYEIQRQMFDELSLKLNGLIHFGANEEYFDKMSDRMRRKIDKIWGEIHTNKYRKNGFIQRKFKREGLTVKLSIDAKEYAYRPCRLTLLDI